MSEFIGSRISLVSKSDIRYVGTLHEIDSVSSTVALENVISFGTEGRRGKPDEEIPPSDQNYEYIVFRGSDVKDLKIEEGPAVKENKPPQPPHDPAILGAARPHPNQNSQNVRSPSQQQRQQWGPPGPFGQGPDFYPPYDPRMHGPGGPFPNGRGGPMPPQAQGYPPMSMYGPPPPGWMPPPPGQFGYGAPGPFGQYPPGPPGPPGPPQHGQAPLRQNQQPNQSQPQNQNDGQDQKQTRNTNKTQPKPEGSQAPKKTPSPPVPSSAPIDKPAEEQKSVESPVVQPAPAVVSPVITLSTHPKPDFTKPIAFQDNAFMMKPASSASQSKNGRIMPAVPLLSPKPPVKTADAPVQVTAGTLDTTAAPAGVEDATALATAAVAAAMASLPKSTGNAQQQGVTDNLTNKLNEMSVRANVHAPRAPRLPNGQGFAGRGRGRGPRPPQEARKVQVPESDFDFVESNAKFDKDSLVKEVVAGDDVLAASEASQGETESTVTPVYNKKSSFFDDLSSEQKDRVESQSGHRPGGREWRGEEQKKNLDTFGQGSVDNGYRGGFRGRGRGGRGRGRGYGGRGRGGDGNASGGYAS